MPRIQLDGVAEDLPAAVQRLQGTQVQTLHTVADGACAIHSIWGDWLCGMLFKADARKFLGDAFGSTAEVFKARLSSKELFAELEIAVWEQILPLARQSSAPLANPAQVADREGQHIWNCLLHPCQGVS